MTLEDRITMLPDAGAEFTAWCIAEFGGGIGQQILQFLCQLEHPLLPATRATDRDTWVAIGRLEVIMLLFRRSAEQITASDIPSLPTP